MCVYDDYDGVYFTIQSIRMYHSDVLNDIEFIVIDNNPSSASGQTTKKFVSDLPNGQYVEFTEYSSTSVRNKIFELAKTPYVLCIDCHILLSTGSIKRLIQYFETSDNGDLLHGPLLYDNLKNVSTGFNNEWGSYMHGRWDFDKRYTDSDSDPFDIFAHGMGLFACRKDSWLGFNPNFRGFGGEEIYIHNKYRKHGKRVILLPFLQWVHRFDRPNGVPYTNTYEDRYRNYLIGRIELQMDSDDVEDTFSEIISEHRREEIKSEIVKLFSNSKCRCKS